MFTEIRNHYERSVIDVCVTTTMLNYFGGIIKPLYLQESKSHEQNYDADKMWKEMMSKTRKVNYTKLLNHKRNKKN